MKVVLEMPIFFLSNIDINFGNGSLEKLTWRYYIAVEALPTINKVYPINKKKFAKLVLDKNLENIFVYISVLEAPKKLIHLF